MMWIRIQIRTEPQYGRPPGFGSDGANPDPYSGGKNLQKCAGKSAENPK